jgi:hypothetical protein
MSNNKEYHKKYAEGIVSQAKKSNRVYRPLTQEDVERTLKELEELRQKNVEEEVKMVTLDVYGYKFTMAEKAVPFWWRDKIIKD